MKIGLFCAAGFSTGMLVNNMKKAADKKGLMIEIEAYPQSQLCECLAEIDVALLGPQVSYTLTKSEPLCKEANVPLAVIPMAVYGMLDGEKVLNIALELSGKQVLA